MDSKNYSGTQLATALTSALSATAVTGVIGFVITCAFDDTTNKFTFNSSGSVADPKNYTIGTNTTLLKELGLRGTPASIINNTMIPGYIKEQKIIELLDGAKTAS
mgnify:CR=1 FL=1